MGMQLQTTPQDDPDFVQLITALLNCVVHRRSPKVVALIQIDNWFDHSWLHISGKAVGAVGLCLKELTLPPFHPHRVKSQTVYGRTSNGDYEKIDAPPLHVAQSSPENFRRKFKHAAESGIFAWWTSTRSRTAEAASWSMPGRATNLLRGSSRSCEIRNGESTRRMESRLTASGGIWRDWGTPQP